jgi:hypothetical protein
VQANTHEKIAKLRNITRARGATAGEEAAARAAIERLLQNESSGAELDDELVQMLDPARRSSAGSIARAALLAVAAAWIWTRVLSKARA